MCKKIIIPFLISAACLTGHSCFPQHIKKETQPEKFRAIHYTVEDGMSEDAMHTMIKDAKGFLWVGSVGGQLSRFDGMVFKNYIPDPQKRDAINADVIYSFEEDKLGNIWMGTEKGLSRYDIKADTFTNFLPLMGSAFTELTMAPFQGTKEEIFCKEPGSLITAFNIHTLKRRKLLSLSKEVDTLVHWNTNKAFFDTGSNSIWMLTYTGRDNGALAQIFVDGKAQLYSWPCFSSNATHRYSAEDMQHDSKRNSIWVNSGEGLIEFSLKDKQFRRIEALNALTNSKNYDRGVGIDIDKKGRIWFSTYNHGLFIYNPETEAVQQVFSDRDLQQKTGEANLHIYCDRDGIVWASNWSAWGIFEILPDDPPVLLFAANPQKEDSLSSPSIFSIRPAANNEIWIGTEDGLNILNTKTNKIQVLRQKDLPGLKGNLITPVHIDTIRQKAWISCATSANPFALDLYEMDMITKRVTPIIFRDGTKILDSIDASPGWFHPHRNGFVFYDEKHGIFEIKNNSLFADLVTPFKQRGIGRIELVQERYLFLRHTKENQFCFENKNGKWIQTPHIFNSLEWRGMYYNSKDQTTWVSLKYELIHYDKDFRKLRSYRQENGYSSRAYGMIADNKGNLWFNNLLHQLNRLDINQGIITIISEAEGLKQSLGYFTPTAKDISGDIYFGNAQLGNIKSGGLYRILPEKYSSRVTSSVYLRTLLINQKPFSLYTEINNAEELSLSYNQNTISIETGIIDFYAKGKGRIRYKLEAEGNKEDWQYAPNYYTIRYEKLPPGKYKITLQSSNAVNEFNSPEKILRITINPAFWNTWVFRTVAIILVLSLFYSVIRYRTKQKFRRQLERSEKETQMAEMRQRTAELEQQKTELEMQALRAQMNPHFIFNSLNSINRFILQNNKAQASEYLIKFSKLVRLILQNSQASLITLESELEALGLYLEMEALRVDYHFDYKISVPKALDIEVLKVPPLIIQPYVENAIWHGLMHKEEKGQLNIEVSQEDDWLYFKVTDNGIGRKKAAEIASKSMSKHKSMGLKITANRIAMLQQSNGEEESPVTINDLVNDDGSGAGTEVVIKMQVTEEANEL